ncbi:hypothetical protein IFM89_038816 [Coptis chinensis]|uniref:BHLH domain-containing protein n=1 Tax=Coptis chinensis TaxID=261450 RepID=A0A835HS75_9MAGN|nr:hypothetical protein IFM89_038816 [Coptis chinensis]
MLPFQNYYGFGSYSSRDGFPRTLGSMDMVIHSGDGGSTILSNSSTEKKSVSASKSHSEAEKRRRERINGHLRSLRTLLPSTTKSDKASLLAEVVHQVRELQKLAADVASKEDNGCSSSSTNSTETTVQWPFPGETDELKMSYCDSADPPTSSTWSRIKVSMCCEDRVDLLKDLSQAVKTVRARVVKAEMSTIGGRTKSELVIEKISGGCDEELSLLKRALKSVIDKPMSGTSQVLFRNKRQRLSHHQLYQS